MAINAMLLLTIPPALGAIQHAKKKPNKARFAETIPKMAMKNATMAIRQV